MKPTLRIILVSVLVVALFIIAEILAHTYTKEIATMMLNYGMEGRFFFILMAMVAVIIPLWSNVFLLPFGVVLWGPVETALLCIFGWWIGSVISFYIGRRYGEWLTLKYPSLNKYRVVDSLIPTKYTILSLIFLRMTLPVDILSYALGLFSKRISWKQNAITTLIGITPFAFVFSYIGYFSFLVQVYIFSGTGLFFILYILIRKNSL